MMKKRGERNIKRRKRVKIRIMTKLLKLIL